LHFAELSSIIAAAEHDRFLKPTKVNPLSDSRLDSLLLVTSQ